MTKTEFNDLHESICYGHDAELAIADHRVFIEWNGDCIDLFHVVGDGGEKICTICDNSKLDTVNLLFDTLIFDKTLNNHYDEIEIVDIE